MARLFALTERFEEAILIYEELGSLHPTNIFFLNFPLVLYTSLPRVRVPGESHAEVQCR